MVEDIYDELVNKLIYNEKINLQFGIFNKDFFYEQEKASISNKSVKIKITDSRKIPVINIIDTILLKYHLEKVFIIENKYYYIMKIKNLNNYIILEYVVNSHVQIPRCILKEFSLEEQNNKLAYINIEDMKIKYESPKKFNTIYGYYKKDFEEYLNTNYESQIGVIKSKLKDFDNNKISSVDLTSYVNIIKDIFMIQVYRNPNFVAEFNDESVSSKIIGNYSTENIVEFHNMIKFENMFKDKMVTIVINKTLEGLITTRATISSILIDNGNEMIIMPLSPKFAIALVEKKYFYEKNIKDNMFQYMRIDSITELRKLNKFILYNAKSIKNESIIGLKEDLDILIKH